MKVRIKFQKYGSMKFVGHLDVMRYFQKAFRRGNVDSEYSKGFNPHQIMSFAAPLGVGLTSDAEYVDIQLHSSESAELMIDRMNKVMSEGFRIIGWHFLKEREENQKAVTAMSLVESADYLVSLKDGYQISDKLLTMEQLQMEFEKFLSQPEIVINKKTKTSEKPVDIKPMITMAAYHIEEYDSRLKDKVLQGKLNCPKRQESVADIYENGVKLFLQVDTGSAANLKPELVMEAFYEYLGLPFNPFAWQVHRLEVYTRIEEGRLATLDQVER